jgi:beta-phosphoglucomutase-like phosphatase (HAD superfamily)
MALHELEVAPEEAIVFEDSPNGIIGAHNADIFCVAIPNFISSQLGVDHADLVLESLADISLDELLAVPNRQLER